MGKRILITGANSYIGTSFENWVRQWPETYIVDTIDMVDGSWREYDFSGYDTVFHVAGIAHVSSDPKLKDLYYKVNRDLAIETAQKAKKQKVKQFIFMSSMIVYGSKNAMIAKDTIPQPDNFYGDSKLQAENGLRPLRDEAFRMVILRPPMIYGKGCRGNYQALVKIAKKVPFFPNIDNRRSMLYIDNLCEFVRLMIENEESCLFWPQNEEYVKTAELVRLIAEAHGKRVRLVRGLNWAVRLIGCIPGKPKALVKKAFGSLVYELEMSEYSRAYNGFDIAASIQITEGLSA